MLHDCVGKCPNAEVMHPCICKEDPLEIDCSSNQQINLKKTFNDLSKTLKDNEKHF